MKRKGSLRRVKWIAMGAEGIVIRKEGIAIRAKRIPLIAEEIAMGTEEVALGAEGIAIGAGGYAMIGSRRDRHRSKWDCHGFRRGRFENYEQNVTPMELKGSKFEKEGIATGANGNVMRA